MYSHIAPSIVNTCNTCCWSERIISFIIFSIMWVNMKAAFSPGENVVAYITCGCSLIAGAYESVATTHFRMWVPVSRNFERSSAWNSLEPTCVTVWGGNLNVCFQRVHLQDENVCHYCKIHSFSPCQSVRLQRNTSVRLLFRKWFGKHLKKKTKIRRKSFCEPSFHLTINGALKRIETGQRWKNARKLPDICHVFLQMSGSHFAFFNCFSPFVSSTNP